MADIHRISELAGINNKTAVMSTSVTGKSTKRTIRSNSPVNLTIISVESKFDNRFDDPSYYYGNGTQGT